MKKWNQLKKKPSWHLLPMDALEEIAKVLDFGTEKHGERSWEDGIKYSEIFASKLRHDKEFFQDRVDHDLESGLLHTAHSACKALFLLAYQLRKIEDIDDRPRLK